MPSHSRNHVVNKNTVSKSTVSKSTVSKSKGPFSCLVFSLMALPSTTLAAGESAQDASAVASSVMVVTGQRESEVAPGSYRAEASSLANKQSVEFLEQARTINVVTRQVMHDFNLDDLEESLQPVAGIQLGNTLGGTEDGFVKRGFGSNSDGSMLIDGIRQPRRTYTTATVDRVEVLKGPSSLFQGQQNPGGVINMVTKRPQYETHTEISGEVSSFGGGNTTLDTTGPIEDTGLAYRFILSHEDEDSWREYGNDRRTTIAPSLRWEGEHSSAQISYEYQDYELDIDRGTVFYNGSAANVTRGTRFDESWNRVYGHDESVNAWWKQEVTDNWDMKLTYGWTRRQYSDARANVTNVSDSGDVTVRAEENQGYERSEHYTALDAMGDVEIAGQRHQLVIGADYETTRDYLDERYFGDSVTVSTVTDVNHGQLAQVTSDDINTSRSNRLDESQAIGVYVSDRWYLSDKWILGLGGRYTWFDQQSGQGEDFVSDPDYSDDLFLPSANLLYRIDDASSAYISYSESFVPNGSDSDSGESLDPELGKGYEIGYKRQWNPRLATSVALYQIRKENVAVTDNGVTRTIGEAGSQGLEFSLEGALTDRTSLLFSYAYTDTEVLEDTEGTEGNRLPNAALNAASLYLAHDLAIDPSYGEWRVGGGVRYVGEREGDDDNSFSMDAYTVADAFVGWRHDFFGPDTEFKLNAKNLFDTAYYYGSGGDTRVLVGDPMEITLSASVGW
ncbi:TonB-dependent siderophore receptor [Cobetia sp. 5-11-6-3]|uniref:TonB-dependent siderophore receptor n=1 Tax=Cobetia sp. 5-11-6-3 TaxID=2737458 RepID=UPI0021001546|nr:TonB-dependent siderophore receptor [Cobetia sp. 5-11-6-3]